MADLIANGLAFLNRQLASNVSQSYTYRRGADSVVLDVTVGKAKVDPLNLLSGVIANRDLSQPSAKHVDHRFSFAAADLTLGEPIDGDTLEVETDGVTTVYILASPHDGGPPWSYASGYESGDAARILWNGRLKSVN